MSFKEFSEFDNPEAKDYDLHTHGQNHEDELNKMMSDKYQDELMDLIGIVEDIDDNDIVEEYGITLDEYDHPTAETIKKVKAKLESKSKHM